MTSLAGAGGAGSGAVGVRTPHCTVCIYRNKAPPSLPRLLRALNNETHCDARCPIVTLCYSRNSTRCDVASIGPRLQLCSRPALLLHSRLYPAESTDIGLSMGLLVKRQKPLPGVYSPGAWQRQGQGCASDWWKLSASAKL